MLTSTIHQSNYYSASKRLVVIKTINLNSEFTSAAADAAKEPNKKSGLVRYCSISTESTSIPNILSKASLGSLTDVDISALAAFLEPACLYLNST